MGQFVKVARKKDIPEDTGLHIEVEGREVALFKYEGKVYAIDHICPHAGGPLAEGGLTGSQVMCPWHGWEFDLKTGVCGFNDRIKVPVFKVKEEGDDIFIEI